MPQTKNGTRWKPRIKQQEAIEKIKAKPFGKYLFVLPGGYGKTKAAIGAYCAARDSGAINRLLVVAPSREQRDAWLDCLSDFKEIEQPIKTFKVNGVNGKSFDFCATDVGGCAWAQKRHLKNECEVYVITIQSLCSVSGKSSVNELMSKGRWMVVAEEAHHYAVTKQWGEAISDLDYVLLIGLSATPFRKMGKHVFSVIMEEGDRVVECSIADALKEGAIRPIKVIRGQYQVEFQTRDKSETYAFKLAELSSYLYDNSLSLSEFEAKKELRVLDQFVKPIFLKALDKLDELNSMDYKQHQMIVHAPSVLTAKTYCNWINLLTDNFNGVSAQWVGTGADQSDTENRQIIADFKANKFPILVQVQMFGEGSDNVRASVGLWLSLIGSDNSTCWQGMVRHSRRNYAIPQSRDVAYLFIPEDSPGLERAIALQNASENIWDIEGDPPREGDWEPSGPNVPPIDWIENQVKASAAELLGIFDGDDYRRKASEIRRAIDREMGSVAVSIQEKTGMSRQGAMEVAAQVLETQFDHLLTKSLTRTYEKLTEEQLKDQWSHQVESAVKKISRYVAFKLHPHSVEKSTISTLNRTLLGTVKRKVNAQLKKKSGYKGRKDLDVEGLRLQYEYLAQISRQIEEGDIPTWLIM